MDISQLTKILNETAMNYPPVILPTAPQIRAYANTLADYSIEQIGAAAQSHIASVFGYRFPSVHDLLKHMRSPEFTPESLLNEVMLKTTPLGCLIRVYFVQTCDLESKNRGFLLDRIKLAIARIPEWRGKALRGDYSNAELESMVAAGVSPYCRLSDNLESPMMPDSQEKIAIALAGINREKLLLKNDSGDTANTHQDVGRAIAEIRASFDG